MLLIAVYQGQDRGESAALENQFMKTRPLSLRYSEAARYLKGRRDRSIQQVKSDNDRARLMRLTNLYTWMDRCADGFALGGAVTAYRSFE
jgi:hypothetical protein